MIHLNLDAMIRFRPWHVARLWPHQHVTPVLAKRSFNLLPPLDWQPYQLAVLHLIPFLKWNPPTVSAEWMTTVRIVPLRTALGFPTWVSKQAGIMLSLYLDGEATVETIDWSLRAHPKLHIGESVVESVKGWMVGNLRTNTIKTHHNASSFVRKDRTAMDIPCPGTRTACFGLRVTSGAEARIGVGLIVTSKTSVANLWTSNQIFRRIFWMF